VSDPESFLSRWSRLKRESNTVVRPESGPGPGPGPAASAAGSAEALKVATVGVEPTAVAVEAAAVAVEPTRCDAVASPAPLFDPVSLPPVASITGTSDIRQFLQAGVPAELVRAALRAAWVTDPTIRDFIGIADNQWDFNDTTAMPGFGPLEAADSARAFAQRSAARVNEAAEAVARMPELATRSAVDAANLPREGQVDRVWLSAGMTEQGGSGIASASLPPQTRQSVTDPDPKADPSRERAAAVDSSDLHPGPRVHGTALPKART
jgi:Protein of unknown function (DUF3306)